MGHCITEREVWKRSCSISWAEPVPRASVACGGSSPPSALLLKSSQNFTPCPIFLFWYNPPNILPPPLLSHSLPLLQFPNIKRMLLHSIFRAQSWRKTKQYYVVMHLIKVSWEKPSPTCLVFSPLICFHPGCETRGMSGMPGAVFTDSYCMGQKTGACLLYIFDMF